MNRFEALEQAIGGEASGLALEFLDDERRSGNRPARAQSRQLAKVRRQRSQHERCGCAGAHHARQQHQGERASALPDRIHQIPDRVLCDVARRLCHVVSAHAFTRSGQQGDLAELLAQHQQPRADALREHFRHTRLISDSLGQRLPGDERLERLCPLRRSAIDNRRGRLESLHPGQTFVDLGRGHDQDRLALIGQFRDQFCQCLAGSLAGGTPRGFGFGQDHQPMLRHHRQGAH